MSLQINVNTVDDEGERIIVHAGHNEVDQLDYQPTENASYDDDVEHMSVRNFFR